MGTSASRRSLDRGDLPTVFLGVLLVNVVGGAPALLAGPDSAWFQQLTTPELYPPGWVFGVVWTGLFTLLGIGLALVWLAGTDRRDVRIALGLFALQMAFNVAWTPAFFALENLLLGLVVIVSLWPLVIVTIAAFASVDRRAGALLVPYLLWVTFAAVLNYQFWAVN
jgi:tryptophan-rich sensory protein